MLLNAFDSVPKRSILPEELSPMVAAAMDPNVKRESILVTPTGNGSVSTTFSIPLTSSTICPDVNQPQSEIKFDIPCSQGMGCVVDTRLTTLNFTSTWTCNVAPTSVPTYAYLRSSAAAFFDNVRYVSGSGGQVETIPEYGLVYDLLSKTQISFSDRVNQALLLGFDYPPQEVGAIGHSIPVISSASVSGNTFTRSYSIPLISAFLGQTADQFLPIGLLKKLQLILQPSSILPVTILTNGTASTTAGNYTCQISNFSLGLEIIDIGVANMQAIIDKNPDPNKLFYLHGTTYNTTTGTIPAGQSGSLSIPLGLAASSCKSLMARFYETGTPSTTTSCHGKYSAKNPLISGYQWKISGRPWPVSGLSNPLLFPSRTMRNLMMAMGCFNSSMYHTSITPASYCVVSSGGASSGLTSSTQDGTYTTSDSVLTPSCFFLGDDCESVSRKGILNGMDLQLQKLSLDLQFQGQVTNAHTVYVTSMQDIVFTLNPFTGDIVPIF